MRALSFIVLAICVAVSGCAFEPSAFDALDDRDGGIDLDATTDGGQTSSGDAGANANTGPNSGPNQTTPNGGPNTALNNTTTRDAGGRDAGRDAGDAGQPNDAGTDAGPTTCDGQVVDLQTSNAHCGSCGNACDPDYGQCRRGQCECVDPYTACGADNRCTDALVDPSNCGVCGTVCDTGQSCDSGTCRCLPDLTLCAGECVDTENDPRHCGQCNESCGDTACRGGMCRGGSSCGPLVLECGLSSGGTFCVDDASSPLSCNASILDECGDVCAGNELCYRSGLIEPRRCRVYRPARGCVNCPCADCSDAGENCVELDGLPDKPFCVE